MPPQDWRDQRALGIDEAPRNDQQRIIGVELTAISPSGERAELEMLAVRHTLPRLGYGQPMRIQVTLHTTQGDRNAVIDL